MSEGFIVGDFSVSIDMNEDYPICINDKASDDHVWMTLEEFDGIVKEMRKTTGE